jgi:hypothetical protein
MVPLMSYKVLSESNEKLSSRNPIPAAPVRPNTCCETLSQEGPLYFWATLSLESIFGRHQLC